jgi:hypothetical protein
MKRKESPAVEALSEVQADLREGERLGEDDVEALTAGQRVFLLENGRLKPFPMDDYTRSTLYEMVESFSVECRLVKPEESDQPIYEGKKPSKKTVPILVDKKGEYILMTSWEELEAHPEKLAEVSEVIGVSPVKQVFVLKRKQ